MDVAEQLHSGDQAPALVTRGLCIEHRALGGFVKDVSLGV